MEISKNITLPQFDGVLINRLLRRDSVEQAVKIIKLVLVGFCIILTVLILRSGISSFLHLNNSITEADTQLKIKLQENQSSNQANSPKRAVNTDILKGKGLFGEIGVKPVAPTSTAPTIPVPKAKPLSLTLVGTFLTTGAEPFAIIENKKDGSQEPFNKGDKVFDEAKLVAIFYDKVELNRDGQIETLKIDDAPDNSDTSSTPGISAQAGELVIVPETELNQALDNLPLLLTQARAVPYFKDGQSVGLRLFAIKTGSLYERIGLKNGDILKSINGNSLGDITQAVKLFERLREERSIGLEIERNRQAQNIKYEIR